MATETEDEKSFREWRASLPHDWVKPTGEEIEAEMVLLRADCKRGSDYLDAIKSRFPNFAEEYRGQYIRVNMKTGDYIIANSEYEATKQFKTRFGSGTPCLNERIGYPIYVRDPAGILF
jgi:hypothetical protein